MIFYLWPDGARLDCMYILLKFILFLILNDIVLYKHLIKLSSGAKLILERFKYISLSTHNPNSHCILCSAWYRERTWILESNTGIDIYYATLRNLSSLSFCVLICKMEMIRIFQITNILDCAYKWHKINGFIHCYNPLLFQVLCKWVRKGQGQILLRFWIPFNFHEMAVITSNIF